MKKFNIALEDIIIISVILLIVGLAAFYVYKAKKSGKNVSGYR